MEARGCTSTYFRLCEARQSESAGPINLDRGSPERFAINFDCKQFMNIIIFSNIFFKYILVIKHFTDGKQKQGARDRFVSKYRNI